MTRLGSLDPRPAADAVAALALLEALYADAPVGMGFVDRNLHRILANNRLAGFNDSTLLDSVFPADPGPDPAGWLPFQRHYRHVLDTGEAVLDIEVIDESETDSAEARRWAVSCYPVHLAGEIIGVGFVAIDRAHQHAVELCRNELASTVERSVAETVSVDAGGVDLQREQAHRLTSLGQFAGGVAHEFNNLLGVILTYSALLLRHTKDPAVVADLEEIQTAAHSGTALTRQLLTFARRDMATPEPTEINAVTRSVAATLEPALGERIVLCLELDPGPLVTIADRYQLEQIVLNLATNAVDAMPTGGQLSITTTLVPRPVPDRDDGPRSYDIVIDVRDDGVGMAADVASRAFEPFYSTKPAGHRTGLGLATVYGIVRDAGGEVSISSIPGEGTTVTVTLPAATQTQPAAPEGPRTVGGSGEQILVVEDREPLRRATERILTADGYRVIVAADGVEALKLYEQYKDSIDMVLTDLVMPRLRGDELARALEAAGCSAPIVFMSGYDSRSEHDSLAHLLLPKPISTHNLLRTIWEVLHD